MDVREGRVTVSVPEQADEGVGESVFFNPVQELNRDLTVAVLEAYCDREPRATDYLDAMAASGVRGVRAAERGWAVTCCDVDAEAVELCRENLARNGLEGEVVQRDVNALMHDGYFDVVDLDPFGSPMPFADAAFANARDLVCVTATDTAPLCGAHFDSGVRSYAAVPRNTEYHAEMGLRVLISALVRTAARYDTAAVPVFSHATNHYVRTYLELDGGATVANEAVDRLGSVHHCPECLARDHEYGLIAHPPEVCPACGSDQVVTAGPIYLDAVRDPDFTESVRTAVTDDMGTAGRARDLCDTLVAELDTPTHYDQHRLYKRWGEPAIAMDDFLGALDAAGYDTSRTHYGGTTFKTDADVTAIRDAVAEGTETV